MPKGNPKQLITGRIDSKVVTDVKSVAENVSAVIEEALTMWLKAKAQKAPKNRQA